jgi:hypothetical protein
MFPNCPCRISAPVRPGIEFTRVETKIVPSRKPATNDFPISETVNTEITVIQPGFARCDSYSLCKAEPSKGRKLYAEEDALASGMPENASALYKRGRDTKKLETDMVKAQKRTPRLTAPDRNYCSESRRDGRRRRGRETT